MEKNENKEKKTKKVLSMAGKVLNVCWKVALVFIALLIARVIISTLLEHSRRYFEDNHYWDRPLSENIGVHYYRNGKCRVYDSKAEAYVTPRLKWVSDVSYRDSLIVFCDKDDKRGFLNVNTGKIVLEGRYEHAWVFSEGLAAVVEPDGKMGFIDYTGQYVIAPKIDYFPTHDYVFKHGVCCIKNKDGKLGLLSRDGQWVLPQEYDFISYVSEPDMFIPKTGGKEGLVKNGSFEWVYPMEYDDIAWTDAPSGKGFILYKDYQSRHVALDGTVLNDFVVDEVEEMKYMSQYHEDEADEYVLSDQVMAFLVYTHWGVMDKHTGKVLVPALYDKVRMASENVIECKLDEDNCGDYVLFDLKGNKIN